MIATKITITVGAKFRRDGSKIDTDTPCPSELDFMVEIAQNYLLKYFGGYTIMRGNGGWREHIAPGLPGDFTDWVEPVIVFSVTTTSSINPREIARELREIFQQQCVALETTSVNFDLI